MPFGYSREIFKYPAVQYIPLDRYNEKTWDTKRTSGTTRANVYTYLEEERLKKKLAFLQYNENYSISKGELAVIIKNGTADLVKYRGYEVIMVGEVESGTYQLFTVTTKYFYKDQVLFILYNGETSERLDIAHVNEPTRNL
ncbi:MAG: hypothetical protein ACLFPF_00305 [Halanaerobiales bacterium]